jgi:Tol biopolymer transport system component
MPAGDPAPSPDGARVAFVSRRAGEESDIWVVGRDGTGLTRLTNDPARDDEPAWSPDGRRILFRSFRAGALGDVWVMDADGGNPVNLTPDAPSLPIGERDPAWSPDGARIAYASGVRPCARREEEIDADWGLRRSCTGWSIWTMAADGSDQRRLTTGTRLFGSGTVWMETALTLTETMPAWSPDGGTIAFSMTAAGGEDLVVVGAVGGAAGTPMPAAGGQGMSVWTPDGGQLVFVHQLGPGDGGGILAAVPGATNPQPLVRSQADFAVWNPAVLRRR